MDMTVAERIKATLKEKGLTQLQLSELLGVSHQSVKNILMRADSMNLDTLRKYATALEVPMWYLCVGDLNELAAYVPKEEEEQPHEKWVAYTCPVCGSKLVANTEYTEFPRTYKVTLLDGNNTLLGKFNNIDDATACFDDAINNKHLGFFVYLEESSFDEHGNDLGWTTIKRMFSEK